MTAKRSLAPHETALAAPDIALPSNRSFGLIVGGILAAIGAARALGEPGAVAFIAFGAGALLVALALARPQLLTAPNRLWMRLGLLIGLVMTPVIMGLVYLIAFIPMGAAMKVRGYDPLRRRRKGATESYWVVREPPGPDPRTMPNQF